MLYVIVDYDGGVLGVGNGGGGVFGVELVA